MGDNLPAGVTFNSLTTISKLTSASSEINVSSGLLGSGKFKLADWSISLMLSSGGDISDFDLAVISLATPADDEEVCSLGSELFVSGGTGGEFVDFSLSSVARTKGDGSFVLTYGGKSCDLLLPSGVNFSTSLPPSGDGMGDARKSSASFSGCVALVVVLVLSRVGTPPSLNFCNNNKRNKWLIKYPFQFAKLYIRSLIVHWGNCYPEIRKLYVRIMYF